MLMVICPIGIPPIFQYFIHCSPIAYNLYFGPLRILFSCLKIPISPRSILYSLFSSG
eukprot:c30401_g1_i1 orf=1-168(-)